MQKTYLDGLSFYDREVLLIFCGKTFTCERAKQLMRILHPPELVVIYTQSYKLTFGDVVTSLNFLHQAGYLNRSSENSQTAKYWPTEKGSDICRHS